MQAVDITNIEVPFPEVGEPHLRVILGGGRLRLTPGETEVWSRGWYHDPSGWLPCHVVQQGPVVEIVQNWNWQGPHPAATDGLFRSVPELNLALGKGFPYRLTCELGGADIHADLSGLPLNRLTITQGAGALHLGFSAPNPQAMSALTVRAGAGSVELRNLANANCAAVTVEGGAAAYTLDFGGTLRQPATVKVTGGMCAVDLAVPAGVAARIRTESALGNAEGDAVFTRRDGAFWTPAALAGGTPLLTIAVSVALGAIHLRTR